jgi:hypothetical protein
MRLSDEEFMKSRKWNRFLPYLIILVFPWVAGTPLLADSCPPGMPAAGQSQAQCPRPGEGAAARPIIVAEVPRELCLDKCAGNLQVCVDRCPGFDENNVVDPSYAARRCKTACDKDLSQCRSRCPKE